jgi:hypothetical protein
VGCRRGHGSRSKRLAKLRGVKIWEPAWLVLVPGVGDAMRDRRCDALLGSRGVVELQ